MPPKRGPSNGLAQAGGCRCPGGGDPTSKTSPLAQDASISNRAGARAHHSLTRICPLELKGISKAERAGTAWPHKGEGIWHWGGSLPAHLISCTASLPSMFLPLLFRPCDVLRLFLSPTSPVPQAGSELWKVWRCLLIPWCCPRLRGWLGSGLGALCLPLVQAPAPISLGEGDPFSNICPSPGQEWGCYPQEQLVGGCTLPPVCR